MSNHFGGTYFCSPENWKGPGYWLTFPPGRIPISFSVTAHQDGTFLRNDPLKLVGYWFPIDDATLENGCLWYVPGSHKKVSPVTKHMVRNPLYNPSDKDNNGEEDSFQIEQLT